MKASRKEVDPEVQKILKVFADAGIEIVDFPYIDSRGQLLSCDYGGHQLRFTNTASCEWHVQNDDAYCIECLKFRLREISPLRSVLSRLKKKRVSISEVREKVSQLSLV